MLLDTSACLCYYSRGIPGAALCQWRQRVIQSAIMLPCVRRSTLGWRNERDYHSPTPNALPPEPCMALAGGHWPGAPVGGWAVPSAEPPQQLVQKSSGGLASQDYFGNALHRDSGSPHVRPRGSEQEVRPHIGRIWCASVTRLCCPASVSSGSHCATKSSRFGTISASVGLRSVSSECVPMGK